MPYSLKQESISAEKSLSCPSGKGGAGKENNLQGFPCLGAGLWQSWGHFTAVTRGAVFFWHSYIVLQHNASSLLKVTVEGRTISFLNLLLYPSWHTLPVCNSIMPVIKNLGRKKLKEKKPCEFFCLKRILRSSKHRVTFAYGIH